MPLTTGLDGKVGLVTGAASGIGQAIAVELAREGVFVVLADRQPCDQTNRLVADAGGGAATLEVDVAQRDQVEAMVGAAEHFRGQLDLFVNNAAIARHQPIMELDPETWAANMETNLEGCLWACQGVARIMSAQGSGSILIIGSVAIDITRATEAAYRIAKTGLKPLMEVLAIELASAGVRVNMISPGSFRTGITAAMTEEHLAALDAEIPLLRTAEPVELTATALLLLSDALSPYTTGANFVVDGGIRLRPLRID